MSRAFFVEVVETLIGFLPPEQSGFYSRVTGRNAKVWFGAEAREHYEAQLVRRDGVTVGTDELPRARVAPGSATCAASGWS